MLHVSKDKHKAKFFEESPGSREGYVKRRRKLVERIQHSNYTREKLKVIVKYVSTPDADIRISRAFNILLEANKDKGMNAKLIKRYK